jgi:hypothetical protein
MVCTGVAGFHYGKLVGISAMLQLGNEIYPDFKAKVTKKVMDEANL